MRNGHILVVLELERSNNITTFVVFMSSERFDEEQTYSVSFDWRKPT